MGWPRQRWLIVLPLLAWAGNALYAFGAPEGWLKALSPAIVALSLITYVILHGRARYGARDLVMFALIVFACAWVFETISVITGLPFGNYHYTDIMAPFIGHVPVFVLPAYMLMGYASWSLAGLILGQRQTRPNGIAVVAVPLVAALAMVIWDLSMDPLRATIEQRWIWHDGGAHFGVPVSNYIGWFLVTYTMFQCFAVYLIRAPKTAIRPIVHDTAYWLSLPVAYSAFAVEYLLNPFSGAISDQVVSINGAEMAVQSIYSQIAVLCATTMVPFALMGVLAAAVRVPPLRRRKTQGDVSWK